MNLKTLKIHSLGKVLFAEGWFFFVPYLFFYLVFKYLHLKISNLESIFTVLHSLNAFLFLYYLYKSYRKNHLFNLLFWIGIILLFQIPGAYLEFPSDAWEHFRRIFEWQSCTLIEHHSANYKFSYFWGWTLMSEVEPLYRRTALDIYSTFWQFLLAYQFYLFAVRIGFSESWAKLQVLGTICLFGTNVFGFYRYYALSSTPLAYVAYLQSLIIILDVFDGKRKKALFLTFLLPLIYYNHYQELLLLIISSLAIYIAKLYENKPAKEIKKITYVITISLVISLVIGVLVTKFFQEYPLLISHLWNSSFQDFFQEKTTHHWNIDPNSWSTWGILRLWDEKLPYFQTLGIYGYCSILFSLILWNKYKVISTLTLLPILLLLFQPLTLIIATIDDYYTTFRILYAFPYSFMLIVGFKEMFNCLDKIYKKDMNSYVIIIVLLIVLSFQANFPWRGRLWHQLYSTPVKLALKNLDVTAQWFSKNRNLENQYIDAQLFFETPRINAQCLVVADNATSFSLATHLGLIPPQKRLFPYNPNQNLNTVDSLKNYIQSPTHQKPCSFLVRLPTRTNPPPISKIGELSGHWLPDIVRQDLKYSKEYAEATAFLRTLGWSTTFVPPFYLLYEAPSRETPQ